MNHHQHSSHPSGYLAASYRAGRQAVSQMADDLTRYRFLNQLLSAAADGRSEIFLTDDQQYFCLRLISEQDLARARGERSPDIHPGDRNICDRLQRQYGEKI